MDGSFDDFRATSYLQCKKEVDFIVYTEGISRPKVAAENLEFIGKLHKFKRSDFLKHIRGSRHGRLLSKKWQEVRKRDEALNSFLSRAEKKRPQRKLESMDSLVRSLQKSCHSVEYIILGPYTSFSEVIKRYPKIPMRRIVTMGKLEPSAFNCWFDLESCSEIRENKRVVDRLEPVVVPEKDQNGEKFGYHKKWVDRLKDPKMKFWKDVFESNRQGWNGPEMLAWDDVVVQYFLDPNGFSVYNKSHVPVMGRDTYLNKWHEVMKTCRRVGE